MMKSIVLLATVIFLVAGCAGLSDAQQLTGTDAVGGTAVGSPSGSAVATEATGLKPAQPAKILIEYVPPMDPKHEAIYKWIKEHELLELMQMVLSPFRLSFSVTLRFKGCNGVRNAYYDPEGHTVDVCYEYLQDIVDKAPATTTSGGVTGEDCDIDGPHGRGVPARVATHAGPPVQCAFTWERGGFGRRGGGVCDDAVRAGVCAKGNRRRATVMETRRKRRGTS